jgi:hypothetical protein
MESASSPGKLPLIAVADSADVASIVVTPLSGSEHVITTVAVDGTGLERGTPEAEAIAQLGGVVSILKLASAAFPARSVTVAV